MGTDINHTLAGLRPADRLHWLYEHYATEEVLVTSSLGAHSVYLLSLIARIAPQQAVYFIDTGYHFRETLTYKARLEERLGLRIHALPPDAGRHARTRREQLWRESPDMCCHINKVEVLQPLIESHQVWVSGLMAFQTSHRRERVFWEERGSRIKFYPLLDIPEPQMERELQNLQLPLHPLRRKGYGSIGCTHCTAPGKGRSGRWQGKQKVECGLHGR